MPLIINDDNLKNGLMALQFAAGNTAPAMREIAAIMADRAEESFDMEQSPEGVPWAELSEVTMKFRRAIGRDTGKKLKVTGQLAASISSQYGDGFAKVGTNKVYAAMQQFGGTTSPRSMIPDKDIPARPFLGSNQNDRNEMADVINKFIVKAFREQ